jgi:hypothetical protein
MAQGVKTVLPFDQYKPDIPSLHVLPHLQMSIPTPDTTTPWDRRLRNQHRSLLTENPQCHGLGPKWQ